MNIVGVIQQLRALAPLFNGNVAGAAAYARGVEDQVWLPMPAAYVVPLHDSVGANESMSGLYQIVTQNFAVIVVIDNSSDPSDRRGQSAVQSLDAIQAGIRKAIVNWRPDVNYLAPGLTNEVKGIRETGGGLIEFDRSRLRWQFEFALDVTLTDSDCWQPVGPALEAAEVTLAIYQATIGRFVIGGTDIEQELDVTVLFPQQ